jgi:tetratricopeptide (TPR) repeat protein
LADVADRLTKGAAVRFDKLEFDQSGEQPSGKKAEPRVERNEKYWMQLADDNRRTGSYETALRFYSRALETDKTIVVAWVGQVQMLVQLGEYPQAGLWSQKALELFPSHGDLMAGQAQAECRMGNMKKAHTLSDGALRQRGESGYRWQVRGELMVAGRQRTDRHCFDKAQIADHDWLVPLETAVIYCHYRAYNMALQRAQLAAEMAPGAYYAWYLLGACQAKLGFDTSARGSLQRCLELCPRHAGALSRLSELERPRWPLSRLLGRLMGR